MDRIGEIRESLKECQKYGGFVEGYISADDVSYLLERTDEQDRGLWEAAGEVDKLLNRIAELTRENERMREACNRILNVHGGQDDYVDAVLHMSKTMQEIEAR